MQMQDVFRIAARGMIGVINYGDMHGMVMHLITVCMRMHRSCRHARH